MPITFTSYFPAAQLILWMSIAVFIDLAAGSVHAYRLGTFSFKTGLNKTASKFCQYTGAIAAAIILANIGGKNANPQLAALLSFANDGLVMFITYVEVRSFVWHLVQIDRESLMSKYLFLPTLRILTFSIKNNQLSTSYEKTTIDPDSDKPNSKL